MSAMRQSVATPAVLTTTSTRPSSFKICNDVNDRHAFECRSGLKNRFPREKGDVDACLPVALSSLNFSRGRTAAGHLSNQKRPLGEVWRPRDPQSHSRRRRIVPQHTPEAGGRKAVPKATVSVGVYSFYGLTSAAGRRPRGGAYLEPPVAKALYDSSTDAFAATHNEGHLQGGTVRRRKSVLNFLVYVVGEVFLQGPWPRGIGHPMCTVHLTLCHSHPIPPHPPLTCRSFSLIMCSAAYKSCLYVTFHTLGPQGTSLAETPAYFCARWRHSVPCSKSCSEHSL